MASVDFKLVSGGPNKSVLVMAFNEEAYNFLTEDCPVTPVSGGYVQLSHSECGDFLSDAAFAHFVCEYA